MCKNLKGRLLKHKRNKYIVFDEDAHKYTYFPSGDKRKTTEAIQFGGITSWFGQYCSKFDADAVAKSCNKNPNSEYYGWGVQKIKDFWTANRDKGSHIHKAIENSINTGEIDTDWEEHIDSFWDIMDKHGIEPIVSEFVVYDEDVQRATPVDVIGVKDGKIVPIDVKTFRKGMDFRTYNKMKHPLGNLRENRYTKVALQVGIEKRWLVDKYGFDEKEVHDGYCVVVNDDGADIYPLLDYSSEIQAMYQYE